MMNSVLIGVYVTMLENAQAFNEEGARYAEHPISQEYLNALIGGEGVEDAVKRHIQEMQLVCGIDNRQLMEWLRSSSIPVVRELFGHDR